MKVKELIKFLESQNPEDDVSIDMNYATGGTFHSILAVYVEDVTIPASDKTFVSIIADL